MWRLIFVVVVLPLAAQYPFDPYARGSIAGTVLDYSSGQPMRRVQVVLAPSLDDQNAVAATTDNSGQFRFTDIPAGRYSIRASRPGYLPAAFAQTEFTRLPFVFPLLPGEELEGVIIRLRPAGVISGTVYFGDGEAAVGVPVQLIREYHFRGRQGYEVFGRATSDDRGNYRIFGLPPGSYYVVAAYTPPSPGPGVSQQERFDENGRPVSEESFVTTYYQSTPQMIEAEPVKLRHSEELGRTDIFLTKSRTASIRGVARSSVTGDLLRGPRIRLRQPAPAGEAMVDAPVPARLNADGSFEISGVPPGQYTMLVDGVEDELRLTGRRPLSISAGDVDDFEVLASPFDELKGELSADEDSTVEFDVFRVSIEPHSDATGGVSVSVKADGSFTLPYVAGETYDVFLMEGPPESYLKSASIGGLDVLATSFRAQGGTLPEMQLVVSTKGGAVRGEVAEGDTRVALGATVVLLPDPAGGRVQHYQATSTDEHGLYLFRGVAPGRYTVVAWREDPPCQIYDFDALAACRSAGRSVEVEESALEYVNLRLSEEP